MEAQSIPYCFKKLKTVRMAKLCFFGAARSVADQMERFLKDKGVKHSAPFPSKTSPLAYA